MNVFSNSSNTVEQGSIGLTAAIYQYRRLGYNINVPLVDAQDYDLVIEKNGKFETVSVKTTQFKNKGPSYIVQLKKVRPNRSGNTISPTDETDRLFVLTVEGQCYDIPNAIFSKKNSLNLGIKIQQFLL
jgi:hypothetical protein